MVTTGTASTEVHRAPSIAVDSKDTVHVTWFGSSAANSASYNIYYKNRTAAGFWNAITMVTEDTTDMYHQYPSIAVDSKDNVHVVWSGQTTSVANNNIQYRRRDGTTGTWGSIVMLTSETTNSQENPCIVPDLEDNIHIVWQGEPSPIQIKYIKWDAITEMWGVVEDVTTNSIDNYNPSIGVDQRGYLYVGWHRKDPVPSPIGPYDLRLTMYDGLDWMDEMEVTTQSWFNSTVHQASIMYGNTLPARGTCLTFTAADPDKVGLTNLYWGPTYDFNLTDLGPWKGIPRNKHLYCDDNPSDTERDEYTMRIRVRDDDMAVGEFRTPVMIQNVFPEITSEVTLTIGPESELVLPPIEFKDPGSGPNEKWDYWLDTDNSETLTPLDLTGTVTNTTVIDGKTYGTIPPIKTPFNDDCTGRVGLYLYDDDTPEAIMFPNPTGLVAYWKLDEDSWTGTPGEVVDSSGYGNHGTAYGGATTTASGKLGPAGDFDGKDDYINCGNDASLSITDELTLKAWVKSDSNDDGYIIDKENLGPSILFYDTFTDSDMVLTAHTPDIGSGWTVGYSIGGGNPYISSNTLYDDGVGGSSCGFIAVANDIPPTPDYAVSVRIAQGDTSDDAITLVARWLDASNTYGWKFSGTESSTYNRLFKIVNGVVTDLSTSVGSVYTDDVVALQVIGNTITCFKNDQVVVSVTDNSLTKAGRGGIGHGAFVDAGDDLSSQRTDDFKIISNINCGDVPFILSTKMGGEFLIYKNNTFYTATTSTNVNDGDWHHLVATYNGSEMCLYVDGILEGTNTDYSGSLATNNLNITIGRDYDGLIDEVAIFSHALSAEEIQKDYILGLIGIRFNVKAENAAPGISGPEEHIFAPGEEMPLRITLMDQGSDDLYCKLDWGDGSSTSLMIFYNNEKSPEPVYPPTHSALNGTAPFEADPKLFHTYNMPGTYLINVTLWDDDQWVSSQNGTKLTLIAKVLNPKELKEGAAKMLEPLIPGHLDHLGYRNITLKYNGPDESTLHVYNYIARPPYYWTETLFVTICNLNSGDIIEINGSYLEEGMFGTSLILKLYDKDCQLINTTEIPTLATCIDPMEVGQTYGYYKILGFGKVIGISYHHYSKFALTTEDALDHILRSINKDPRRGYGWWYQIWVWWCGYTHFRELWINDARLDPQFGAVVFCEERWAVRRLMEVVLNCLNPEGVSEIEFEYIGPGTVDIEAYTTSDAWWFTTWKWIHREFDLKNGDSFILNGSMCNSTKLGDRIMFRVYDANTGEQLDIIYVRTSGLWPLEIMPGNIYNEYWKITNSTLISSENSTCWAMWGDADWWDLYFNFWSYPGGSRCGWEVDECYDPVVANQEKTRVCSNITVIWDVIKLLMIADKILANIAHSDAENYTIVNSSYADDYKYHLKMAKRYSYSATSEAKKGRPHHAITDYKSSWKHSILAMKYAFKSNEEEIIEEPYDQCNDTCPCMYNYPWWMEWYITWCNWENPNSEEICGC